MKKISKLICLILSLIFTFSCMGCSSLHEVEELMASLELEVEGYDVVFSEEPLEFARIYTTGSKKRGCIVTYNGEIYQWWTSGFGLTIKKQNEDLNSVTILIDRAYMKARSNEACKIVDFVDKKAQVYFYAAGIIEFDGRLFLYTHLMSNKWIGPFIDQIMIFEYNPIEETIKYAGAMEGFTSSPDVDEENYKGTYLDVNSGDYYHYEQYSMPYQYMAKIIKTN